MTKQILDYLGVDMSVEATSAIRLLASTLILAPAVAGLALQALLGIALYKGWKTFGENSFYIITVQLMWCDVCALMLDLYVAFPLILTGTQTMLICFLIAVEVAAFIFLPFLGIDGYGQFYINMFLNLILIANNMMTPIIIFSFNSDVRKQLKMSLYQRSVSIVTNLKSTVAP
ncbi:hypothetical protein Y032_0198g1627 [Ancylostoma ceylanicum]|uniref:7TM GPCR serpentine receptor class x (Srx) domain-containing protein n=1 Tax=Ancylostoma ceylanicum TaxID=53326 RepID=A0A016SNC7_9BILA|nr:hypothetical protein Y032_0198g1627 [Ancylostoma ceylanicum]